MLKSCVLSAAAALLGLTSTGIAAQITGEYLESRTCSVYTGPCFANAEMGLAGKEAVMAWKVDEGAWNGVALDGLGAALVVTAENTLGDDGIFGMDPGKTNSVIVVDEAATPEQQQALISFVRESAKELAKNVVSVERAPVELRNNHIKGEGVFRAGDVARIETREMRDGDCVCSNEVVYYQPLTKVDNVSPVFTRIMSYQGDDLNSRWTARDERSAFIATFRR